MAGDHRPLAPEGLKEACRASGFWPGPGHILTRAGGRESRTLLSIGTGPQLQRWTRDQTHEERPF